LQSPCLSIYTVNYENSPLFGKIVTGSKQLFTEPESKKNQFRIIEHRKSVVNTIPEYPAQDSGEN
jgi:hypothetical protein